MISTIDWITPCHTYALRLTVEAALQFDRECRSSGTVETGGILVGYYTQDESMAIVTEALPPPKDSARSLSWFYRGVAGLRGLLAKRWNGDRRTYYIGEWHYHPASIVEPSGEDLKQMGGISADSRYQCREPIMIIVGQACVREQRPARAFIFPYGAPYMEFKPSYTIAKSGSKFQKGGTREGAGPDGA